MKFLAVMDTVVLYLGAVSGNKNGRVFTRPFGTFPRPKVSDRPYFGVSVLGAAGFVAPVPVEGLGVEGLVAPDAGAAGGATPDWTL